MTRDLTRFLWLLKLGVLVNLAFLAHSYTAPASAADPAILSCARVFFAVSAFRCLFPVIYKDHVVFHDTALSSIFLTRLLATLSEVAYIFLFSRVLRLLDGDAVGWVDFLSWWMVVQVVVSQGFVWGAILTGRLALFFYEELGWFVIFAANTLASGLLTASDPDGNGRILLLLNLLFGAGYLPWQTLHLRMLLRDARRAGEHLDPWPRPSAAELAAGLRRALHVRKRSTAPAAWGGSIGLTWLTAYWATLIPAWIHGIVVLLSP